MKKLLLIFTFSFFYTAYAQIPGEILGIDQTSAPYETFNSIDLATGNSNVLTSIGIKGIYQGHTTYDWVHDRYFFLNNSDIFVIDAQTGSLIDSIPGMSNFTGIEYDSVCDCLVGIDFFQGNQYFSSIDFVSQTVNHINIVSPQGNYFGESTYDKMNRRYFRMCGQYVEVLDHMGNVLDNIAVQGLGSLEYGIYSDKLFGYYWGSNYLVVGSVDVSTHLYQIVDTILTSTGTLAGESTFDQANEVYYYKNFSEVVGFNVLNHTVHAFPFAGPNQGIAGIEYKAPPPPILTGDRNFANIKHMSSVFPNPGDGNFFFTGNETGCQILIYNVAGQCIYNVPVDQNKILVDLKKEGRGIYFYRLFSKGKETGSGKLVIE